MEKIQFSFYFFVIFFLAGVWLNVCTALLLLQENGKKKQNNLGLQRRKRNNRILRRNSLLGKMKDNVGKKASLTAAAAAQNADKDDGIVLLSRGKPVQGSSVWSSQLSSGVDGDLNQDARKSRGCTHTAVPSSDYPWYMIDLEHRAVVDRIDIYNRMDCCSERLHKFNVYLSDTHYTEHLSENQSCNGEFPGNLQNVPLHHVPCKNKIGRYVFILINDVKSILSLCEVEVFGKFVNECTEGTHKCDRSTSICQPLITGGYKCVKNDLSMLLDINVKSDEIRISEKTA